MKKTDLEKSEVKKLKLHRQTLLQLTSEDLTKIQGATGRPTVPGPIGPFCTGL